MSIRAILRQEEMASLARLPPPPDGSTRAYTLLPITRELLKTVMKPPTRHRTYVVKTYWTRTANGFVPRKHFLMAPYKARSRYYDTGVSGPGVFLP